jgi:hypothetical protein
MGAKPSVLCGAGAVSRAAGRAGRLSGHLQSVSQIPFDGRPVTRIPLTSGAYQARSLIANAQRSINLYMRKQPAGDQPPVPFTLYPRAGLKLLGPACGLRHRPNVYCDSQGNLYMVAGQTVYYVDPSFRLTALGHDRGRGRRSSRWPIMASRAFGGRDRHWLHDRHRSQRRSPRSRTRPSTAATGSATSARFSPSTGRGPSSSISPAPTR